MRVLAALRFQLVVIATALGGLIATARVTGPLFDWVVRWWWVIASLWWLSIVWLLWSVLYKRIQTQSMQRIATGVLAIGAAIATIAAAIVAVNIAMALNPFSLIAIAVVGLGALLVTAYKKFEPFRTVVDTVFGAMKYWINNVTIPAFQTLLAVVKTIFNGIASAWNNTVGKLSFSVPSWVPKIGGKGFDMPDIPMLANGGIVNSPTLALIGERGPEAVIPLSGPNAGMGMGGMNITINTGVGDPVAIGKAVVSSLQAYEKRFGNLPIKVA
jgi:hypothetical protein